MLFFLLNLPWYLDFDLTDLFVKIVDNLLFLVYLSSEIIFVNINPIQFLSHAGNSVVQLFVLCLKSSYLLLSLRDFCKRIIHLGDLIVFLANLIIGSLNPFTLFFNFMSQMINLILSLLCGSAQLIYLCVFLSYFLS